MPALRNVSTFMLVAAAVLVVVATPSAARAVVATMEAPWTETALLQEGCEWAARVFGSRYFFRCLEDVWAYQQQNGTTTENCRAMSQRQQYAILDVVLTGWVTEGFLTESRKALFAMEMASRVYSPAVEAHYVLAEDASLLFADSSSTNADLASCCGEAFAVVRGGPHAAPVAVQQVSALHRVLQTAVKDATHASDRSHRTPPSTARLQSPLHELDHVLPPSYQVGTENVATEVSPVHVFLYGLVGDAHTKQWLTALRDARASSPSVAVSFRHLPVSPRRLCAGRRTVPMDATETIWELPLHVQGYAATLDLKNMEYKVVDEKEAGQRSASAGAASTSPSSELGRASTDTLGEDMVSGVDLKRLRQRYPELSTQLEAFAGDAEQVLGAEEVKISFDRMELQNLGAATVAFIADHAASERLDVLADVAARFPFYASRLAKTASNPARLTVVRRELEQLRTLLRSGVTVAVLDGEPLHTAELSLFRVLQRLQETEARWEGLRSILLLRHGEFVKGGWRDGAMAHVSSERWASVLANLVAIRFQDDALGAALSQASSVSPRLAVRSQSVLWFNDVETDSRFASLPLSLKVLSNPARPILPRRNVLNGVVVLDPSKKESLIAVLQLLQAVREGLPMRVGVVVVDPASTGQFESHFDLEKGRAEGGSASSPLIAAVAATLFHLCRREEPQLEVLGMYLSLLAQSHDVATSEDGTAATPLDVSALFLKETQHVELDDVLRDGAFLEYFYASQETIRSIGLLTGGQRSHVTLLNGRALSDMYKTLNAEVATLAQLVRDGRLDDDSAEDLYDDVLTAASASAHFQPALEAAHPLLSLHQPSEIAFLQDYPFVVASSYDGETALVSQVLLVPCDKASLADWAVAAKAVHALAHCESGDNQPAGCHRTRLTVVSTCPTQPSADHPVSLLEEVLRGVQQGRESDRAAVVDSYMRAVSHAVEGLPRTLALSDANVIARVAAVQWPDSVRRAMSAAAHGDTGVGVEQLRTAFIASLQNAIASPSTKDRLRLLVNGRLVDLDETFVADDFMALSQQALPLAQFALTTLEQLSLVDVAPPASNGFSADELDGDLYSGKAAALASFLGTLGVNEGMMMERHLRQHLHDSRVLVEHVPNRATPAVHHFTAVVDPTDQASQVLIAICRYLAKSPLSVNVTIFLNPPVEVKRAVRDVFTFVANPTLSFDHDSGSVMTPRATFRGMPTDRLLTLGIVEPESWLVMPHRAQDDLDNIILAKLPADRPVLSAVYRIHSLLVVGTAAFGVGEAEVAAAGLPLSLHPASAVMTKPPTNTLVMEKSGYYQLQATAGVWYMAVQAGLMAETFGIASAVRESTTGVGGGGEGRAVANSAELPSTEGSALIVVDGFAGDLTVTTVTMRGESAIADTSAGTGPDKIASIAASMANRFETVWPPTVTGDQPSKPDVPTLNIFSVASGHLYERFLRMMMYSVFRSSSDVHGVNTTRIKFWVIENYLSPRFKAYIPKLAAHYGFEVGFVTYQWPWWLPKQTEKQRKIWAYKVLFLDVIFPLEVDRVIFVDADQTARADLHELYRMDIGGAPVAMTPFCVENMNTATAGFRFWTEGFWLKQLDGRPYHISAIFLVDLQRFRAIRAGDTYRRTYASFASDPHSLANLDQDLPNYLQDRVPIYSLPEEWLWCETWCNAASKARAKTIDLCNNPLTKMPKLENAKMIVPGWEATDNMLESLAETLLPEDATP